MVLQGLQNGANYDYHFIAKELEFRKQFTCLGENTKKFITLGLPMEKKVTGIDENQKENTKNISYILLWQTLDQILVIIYLENVIELTVN